MSIDKSLKINAGLIRHRNVLKRAERVAKLQEQGRWTAESTVTGMPKVRNTKVALGKKSKKKKKDEEEEEK